MTTRFAALCLILASILAPAARATGDAPVRARPIGISQYEDWSSRGGVYRKSLEFRCGQGFESACLDLCGDDFGCSIPESYCRDCAGAAELRLMNFFKFAGTYFVNAGRARFEEGPSLAAVLRSGNFVSISSRSPYNVWTPFDAPELRARFQSLCAPHPSEDPIVIFDVNERRQPTHARWVLCANEGGLVAFEIARRAVLVPENRVLRSAPRSVP